MFSLKILTAGVMMKYFDETEGVMEMGIWMLSSYNANTVDNSLASFSMIWEKYNDKIGGSGIDVRDIGLGNVQGLQGAGVHQLDMGIDGPQVLGRRLDIVGGNDDRWCDIALCHHDSREEE